MWQLCLSTETTINSCISVAKTANHVYLRPQHSQQQCKGLGFQKISVDCLNMSYSCRPLMEVLSNGSFRAGKIDRTSYKDEIPDAGPQYHTDPMSQNMSKDGAEAQMDNNGAAVLGISNEPTKPHRKNKQADDNASACDINTPVAAKKKPATKRPAVGMHTSLRNAMVSMKDKLKPDKVIWEDDNIKVVCNSYTIYVKDTAVHQNEANKALDKELKMRKDMLAQDYNMYSARLREVFETGNDENSHEYILITQKQQTGKYHLVSAFDHKDLMKKVNRLKNACYLLVQFITKDALNVGKFRSIMRAQKLFSSKSRNDFSFHGGDIMQLQTFLVNTINSEIPAGAANYYKISVNGCVEVEAVGAVPTKRKTGNVAKARKPARKDEVRRSQVEEYTDQEDDDDERNIKCRKRRHESIEGDTGRKSSKDDVDGESDQPDGGDGESNKRRKVDECQGDMQSKSPEWSDNDEDEEDEIDDEDYDDEEGDMSG